MTLPDPHLIGAEKGRDIHMRAVTLRDCRLAIVHICSLLCLKPQIRLLLLLRQLSKFVSVVILFEFARLACRSAQVPERIRSP